MTTVRHRRLGVWLIAGGVVVAQSALLASLMSTSASAQPPGNNGTVKIENVTVDNDDDENNANHPHVACPFAVRWYGYDEGTRTFSVSFEAQPPSGVGTTAIVSGPSGGTFQGGGPGDQVDHEEVYEVDTSDLFMQPNQGYHIKMTVTTDGSQGNDTKHKVFWMGACAEESPSPTPSVEPTIEPSVLPTVIESPTVTPSVLGVKIVKPPTALPHTGASTNTLIALFGVALILIGSGLVFRGRELGAHQIT
jgi:LPXTG-motif cell wall-anchored protein